MSRIVPGIILNTFGGQTYKEGMTAEMLWERGLSKGQKFFIIASSPLNGFQTNQGGTDDWVQPPVGTIVKLRTTIPYLGKAAFQYKEEGEQTDIVIYWNRLTPLTGEHDTSSNNVTKPVPYKYDAEAELIKFNERGRNPRRQQTQNVRERTDRDVRCNHCDTPLSECGVHWYGTVDATFYGSVETDGCVNSSDTETDGDSNYETDNMEVMCRECGESLSSEVIDQLIF